ncbi:hypothetical protein CPB86DRAFT_779618 [Serendipita vermifera]|nr:hypothetical protein CPB86DRAFT_779618 [Serendipita vermifera]
MPTQVQDPVKPPKKPGIPRPSVIRQSLGHISKASVSRAITDVIGNKENAKESRRNSGIAIVKAIVKDSKDKDASDDSKTSSKSPLVPAKITKPAKSESSSSSPTSVKKPTIPLTSSSTTSALKPRDSSTTSLPKYRPKASLIPPKQITLRRKRRNSLIEALEEETQQEDSPTKISERPISPLPRRSRVQSNVSTSSRIFDPKISLGSPNKSSTDLLKTPSKQQRGSASTPSSIRIRTISLATTSSRVSGKNDSPIQRTEKRQRLSSDARSTGRSTLATSTSTIAADVSSDSIDIAEMSALLAVSPNVSPVRSIGPSSARRITTRRLPAPSSSGPPTPSRRMGISTLPSRQNMNYLSPQHAVKPSFRRTALPNTMTKDRSAVVSWGDFPPVKLDEEGMNLMAERAPFKGIITPGSEDFHPRERVDSGWGLENPMTSGPSIGQVMFPSVEPPKSSEAPDSSLVTAKLLRLKLTDAEREVQELQGKIHALEGASQPPSPFPAIEVTSNLDVAQELELARLQNAELEAKSAFLEETIDQIRKAVASKDAQLKQASITIEGLEQQCESERQAKEEEKLSAKRLLELTSAEVKKQALSTLEAKAVEAMNLEAKKWMSRINYLTAADDASRQWGAVRMNALADLEVVQQMQATLRVFAAGVDAITPAELP